MGSRQLAKHVIKTVPCPALEQRRKLNRMNAHSKKTRGRVSRAIRALAVLRGLILAIACGPAWGQTRVESLERPGGQRLSGHLAGDSRTGLRLHSLTVIHAAYARNRFDRPFQWFRPCFSRKSAPFPRFDRRIATTFGFAAGITESSVRLGLFWQEREVTMPRPGVQAVVQRPGESRVLVDGFESIATTRWSITGKPEVVALPHLTDNHSLRLPAGGSSLVHNLSEPMAAGRFDVAFLDDGTVVAGQQWSIELTFQGATGSSPVRVVLGWSEESLALESPSGLAVQRLARTPGWHRFSLRFGPTQTEASVDGKELANGKGPDGPLVAIRLASSAPVPTNAPQGAGWSLRRSATDPVRRIAGEPRARYHSRRSPARGRRPALWKLQASRRRAVEHDRRQRADLAPLE